MMKTLRFIIVFLALLCGISQQKAVAENSANVKRYDRVWVQLHDGSQYYISIDTESKVSSYYRETDQDFFLDINGRDYSYHFLRSEVALIKFVECEQEELGIIEIKAEGDDENMRQILYKLGILHFSPSLAGSYATIYSIAGGIVNRFKITAPYSFDTELLPRGAYIVKAGIETFKFINQ